MKSPVFTERGMVSPTCRVLLQTIVISSKLARAAFAWKELSSLPSRKNTKTAINTSTIAPAAIKGIFDRFFPEPVCVRAGPFSVWDSAAGICWLAPAPFIPVVFSIFGVLVAFRSLLIFLYLTLSDSDQQASTAILAAFSICFVINKPSHTLIRTFRVCQNHLKFKYASASFLWQNPVRHPALKERELIIAPGLCNDDLLYYNSLPEVLQW